MKRLDREPDRTVTRIPANVWEPAPGDTLEAWQHRHREYFKGIDYGRGVELRTPAGDVFPSSPIDIVKHRRSQRNTNRAC